MTAANADDDHVDDDQRRRLDRNDRAHGDAGAMAIGPAAIGDMKASSATAWPNQVHSTPDDCQIGAKAAHDRVRREVEPFARRISSRGGGDVAADDERAGINGLSEREPMPRELKRAGRRRDAGGASTPSRTGDVIEHRRPASRKETASSLGLGRAQVEPQRLPDGTLASRLPLFRPLSRSCALRIVRTLPRCGYPR